MVFLAAARSAAAKRRLVLVLGLESGFGLGLVPIPIPISILIPIPLPIPIRGHPLGKQLILLPAPIAILYPILKLVVVRPPRRPAVRMIFYRYGLFSRGIILKFVYSEHSLYNWTSRWFLTTLIIKGGGLNLCQAITRALRYWRCPICPVIVSIGDLL